jgi:D-arabinose 1-dehydrogenase-like Zn-dependent alcohol dehydrogenase
MRAIRMLRERAPLVEQIVDDPLPAPGEVLVDVRCAGICHSDAHYRADASRVRLPLTLGHEIAGVVSGTGERVALHYLLPNGDMLGKERDGGYAERIAVPAANAIPIPAEVPFDQAAIMMCSTATALHALRVAQFRAGQSLGIIGFGGLGISALQLARALGASRVVVADVVPEKLALARDLGAETGALDVDVALDFAGHAGAALGALRALRPGGTLVLVAINLRELTFDPYADVLAKERRIVGCSDHTREELVELMTLGIDLSRAITRRVPLDADAINGVLEDIEQGTAHVRTVIEAAQ